jgi:hypothetical protein
VHPQLGAVGADGVREPTGVPGRHAEP